MNIWNIHFRTFFEYFKGITDAIMNPIKYCGNLLKLIQLLDGLQGVPLQFSTFQELITLKICMHF